MKNINPFKGRVANDKFERTPDLVKKIIPANHYLLVQILPFTKVPHNHKLILPENFKGDFASKARGLLISKGPNCKHDYLNIGDEVYFGGNVSTTINYPNPDESDKQYVTLSEESVVYYVKKS